MNPDFDKAGFCVRCHDPVAEFNGSRADGSMIITKLLPTLRMATVLLDDGSQMRVAMCDRCYETFTPEHSAEIMESVINGWQWELDNLLTHWDESFKKAYMGNMAKRHITDRSDKNWTENEKRAIEKPDTKKLRIAPEIRVALEESRKPGKDKK